MISELSVSTFFTLSSEVFSLKKEIWFPSEKSKKNINTCFHFVELFVIFSLSLSLKEEWVDGWFHLWWFDLFWWFFFSLSPSFCQLVLSVWKNMLFTPIVLMTVLGIVANFWWQHEIPGILKNLCGVRHFQKNMRIVNSLFPPPFPHLPPGPNCHLKNNNFPPPKRNWTVFA